MVSRLRYGVFVLAALLFSVELSAAIVRPASATDVFVKGGQTLNINNHWGEILDVPYSSGSKKVSVDVVQSRGFGWGRVTGMVKNAVKMHPGKIAATAGAMWLIDKIPGAAYDSASDSYVTSPTNTSTTYWIGLSRRRYGTVEQACKSYSSSYTVTANSSGSYYCRNASGQVMWTLTPQTLQCSYGHTNYHCDSGPKVAPLTEIELDDVASHVPNMPEDMWNSGFGHELASIPGTFDGPDIEDFTGPASIDLPSTTTTTTDHATGNTTVTESTPTVNFEYATSPLNITATPSTTTNTYTNGSLTSTSTTTAPSVSGGGGGGETIIEVPTDCDFMPTVCEFIDWVKTPFEPEVFDFSEFIEDQDFQKSVTISGSAFCPEPITITTDLGNFEFSWQPACTWAEMLKPLFLIAALLSAIYITLGIGRSD